MENAPHPAPIPEAVRGTRLPERPRGTAAAPADVTDRVLSIPLFSGHWRKAGEAMAELVAILREEQATSLLETISHMTEPPLVVEETAVRWFAAVRRLPPDTAVVAVQEFLHLGWTWNQIGPSTGLILEDLLSLLYNALEVLGETPADIGLAGSLIRAGFTWPERFGHVLECTRIGGGNVVRALERAKELMPEAVQQARSSLVDFAAGTGWFLLDPEDLPVWRAIGRNGEQLYRKLRGFTIPVESLRLLAGVLGGLEEAGQLDRLLDDAVPETARAILGTIPDDDLGEVVPRLTAGAVEALRRRSEQDLCADLLSLRSLSSAPCAAGRAVVGILLFLGGGIVRHDDLGRILDLLRRTSPGAEKLTSLAEVLRDRTGVPPYLEPDAGATIRLLEAFFAFLDPAAGASRRTQHSVGYLLDAIFEGGRVEAAADILASQIRLAHSKPSHILSAAVLLRRTADHVPVVDLLPRSSRFAGVLDLLADSDRKQILEGVRPQWLGPMTVCNPAAVEQIAQFVEKVTSRELRARFLDKVVAPLIEESCIDDALFQEFLATAVLTYNRDMTMDQLREEETALLRKLFRAEDRTRALGATMERLLSIPGIEENRAGEVVGCARELCESLSRQAVWLERTGNIIYSRFLSEGLPAYVRILVEYPETSDSLTGGLAMELVDTLMPSMETPDSQVALWQLRTVVLFFGRLIPLATEILGGDPGMLAPYLREMAALSISARHGEPAGVNFLGAALPALEARLVKEFERRLSSDSPPVDLPMDISGPLLLEGWIHVRDGAEALLLEALGGLRPVVSDKAQRRTLVREGRRLLEGLLGSGNRDLLVSGGIPPEVRAEIGRMRRAVGNVDLLGVFEALEDPAATRTPGRDFPGAKGFLQEHPAPAGMNACRHWRRRVFTRLENLLIDVLLLTGGRSADPEIDRMLSDFVEISAFLGPDDDGTGPDRFEALEKALSPPEGGPPPTVAAAERSLERSFYKPFWRRLATKRIHEAAPGTASDRKAVRRLFDRMAAEGTTREQILFTKRYGSLFAAIEEDMALRKKGEYKTARSVLDNTWVFNPAAAKYPSVADTAREAVETYVQYFREIGARTGAVSAPEAGAISLGMRRRYRDNAGTVAILLKWTQDPRREKLLGLIEEHPVLLEAVSRDSELIQLMDAQWLSPRARKYMKALADRPDRLREVLAKLAGVVAEGDGSGLKYV